LSRVLLMNNAAFPWVILVPERGGLVEITDLSLSERIMLMAEMALLSGTVKKAFACDKMNVAALGNQVAQLHVHVIGRRKEDAAWPNPVWGRHREAYSPAAADDTIEQLAQALSAAHE